MKALNSWTYQKVGAIAALIGLTTFTTLFIRIPIPATTGYFNLGDIFILLAAIWLGALPGLLVGLIGPTIADAIGYPQFILATAVTKGAEGLIAGIIAGGLSSNSIKRKWVGAAVGGLIIIAGYYVFEAFIYPKLAESNAFFDVTNPGSAVAELLPNACQAIIGTFGAVAIWKIIVGRTSSNDKL